MSDDQNESQEEEIDGPSWEREEDITILKNMHQTEAPKKLIEMR